MGNDRLIYCICNYYIDILANINNLATAIIYNNKTINNILNIIEF